MRKELDELKEEFTKLKGMVRTAVATVNIQNDSFPTVHIVDAFGTVNIYGPQMEKGVSSDEEVPRENVMAIPVPGPLLEIPQMLWEILSSPSPSLQAFLSELVVVVSSILPLGSSTIAHGRLVCGSGCNSRGVQGSSGMRGRDGCDGGGLGQVGGRASD